MVRPAGMVSVRVSNTGRPIAGATVSTSSTYRARPAARVHRAVLPRRRTV